MSSGPSLPLAPCYHPRAGINKGQTSLPSSAHNKGSAWSCTASPHGPVWTRSLASTNGETSPQPDTVIVPAQKEGFETVFLGQDCWYAIRISGGMLDKIKYIAAYQTQPVSAITHYAPVDRIEPDGEGGKCKLIFSMKAKPIGPIPFADAPQGAMQGPRYTTFAKLTAAKKLTDLIGKT
jgi:hypothetical protein